MCFSEFQAEVTDGSSTTDIKPPVTSNTQHSDGAKTLQKKGIQQHMLQSPHYTYTSHIKLSII